ncbi:hypothetical protein [Janthinobacterium fluminis]|uniref:Secretion system X translation initiation factor n=1 Tax=Janthinobacterium fluminis TaxID=2987524 RepID=A0ABT5K0Y8_9BURK|nr:hypothetical protein [Janthinobacterium fluminis]MDC8758642.1 hypothetical protein [Janthinobacterium fluminis]
MRKIVLGAAAAATLLAVYFAPDEEGGVVGPAAATTRERAAAPAPVLPAAAAPAGADLRIEPRHDDSDLGNVFAKQSWQPETPKKIMLAQAAAQPAAKGAGAAPGAPPLPFQFLGRFVDEGRAAYFLQAQGRNVVARVGEKVDEHYILDSVSGDALHFTYLPLNQQQALVVGDMN